MILLLTNEFPPYAGGVATYTHQLARSICARGNAIAVVAAQKHPNDLTFDRLQPFPIYRVPESPTVLMRHWARYRKFQQCIRSCHPSVLWAADWRTGIVVALLARKYALPYIVTAHGTEVLIARERIYRKQIALYVFNHADIILSNSFYTRQLLMDLGINGKKVKVTPLGIDPNASLVAPITVEEIVQRHSLQGKKVILTLARLTARKGQDVMIRAMPEILNSVPSAVYMIAGRGEDEKRLRQLVIELGVESHVIFVGYVSDEEKPAYYQACDLYVMLSRQEGHFVEGFGITLLEAAACGKPVVAGRHGGVQEVVVEGTTGLLVDPNSVGEVSKIVTLMMLDDQLRCEMGVSARDKVLKNATWEVTADLTVAAIANILQ